jgi:hypothetical protein
MIQSMSMAWGFRVPVYPKISGTSTAMAVLNNGQEKDKPEPKIEIETSYGYRQDQLDWNIAGNLQVEQICTVLGVIKGIGSGLINGYCGRFGGRF